MVFMLPFTMQFQDLFKCVCFPYVKANSKEICEEISFPSFFRKMLMSAFLFSFKANYLLHSRLIILKKCMATAILLYGFQ